MARLQFFTYRPAGFSLDDEGRITQLDDRQKPIEHLPQLFWNDGRGWHEANLWALDRRTSGQVEAQTVKRQMKHLGTYLDFLEQNLVHWCHFPVRKDQQALRRFRGHLINKMQEGEISPSTAGNCMRTVVQFYRFAGVHKLTSPLAPMWQDRTVVVPYVDATGFARTITRVSTDLQIPNRRRVGFRLEDGLLPLRAQHVTDLLKFTAKEPSVAVHLMLSVGFFSGARLDTIGTLTSRSIATARVDPLVPGLHFLRVGPGTGIRTKGSVSGEIWVPNLLLDELRDYAETTQHQLRVAIASAEHKGLLFLTKTGKPYTVPVMNVLISVLRKKAQEAGLEFMKYFYFHQTRATFGTSLMQLLLDIRMPTTDAIRLVRDAMLHKHESTTMRYITFLENTRGREKFSAAYNEAFTGIRKGD